LQEELGGDRMVEIILTTKQIRNLYSWWEENSEQGTATTFIDQELKTIFLQCKELFTTEELELINRKV